MAIRVYGPEYVREYIRSQTAPSGYDLDRLTYQATGCWLVYMSGAQPVDPGEVVRVLRDMQRVLPLGALDGMEFLCLEHTVLASDNPANGRADAITLPGYIALSADPSITLWDAVTHEVVHALARRLIDAGELVKLRDLLGDNYGDDAHELWSTSPAERLAEYMSAALWGAPVTERMPQLSSEMLWKVKVWALSSLEKHQPAEIQGPQTTVTLQIGNPVITIDGRPVLLDVAPHKIDPPGRTMVPLRAISEAFGAEVEWDEATQTVTIRK